MKIASLNQIRHLGFTAPEEIRQSLQGVSRRLIARRAAAMRPRADADAVSYATKTAQRTLGRRVVELDAERKQLDRHLDNLLAETAPGLLAPYGVGKHAAANLLVAAGDNPDRLRSEAAWARLCGVSPIEASSGKTTPSPAPPGREPPSQRRLAAHRHHQDELRSPHRRLRRAASQGGANQERDHQGPQALRGSRGLPAHHRRRLKGHTLAAGLTRESADSPNGSSLERSVDPPPPTQDPVDGAQLAY